MTINEKQYLHYATSFNFIPVRSINVFFTFWLSANKTNALSLSRLGKDKDSDKIVKATRFLSKESKGKATWWFFFP